MNNKRNDLKNHFFLFYMCWNIVTTLPVAARIIQPAVITPKTKGGQAFFKGTCKKFAINEPTHAPVPGNGIPTNSINPKKP